MLLLLTLILVFGIQVVCNWVRQLMQQLLVFRLLKRKKTNVVRKA